MKLFIILMLMVGVAQANSLNLAIPNSPQSYQSDSFRAGQLDCSNAIGSATNLEFGVTGIISRETDPLSDSYGQGNTKDIGVYGRITIPIGGPKERINCNDLYQIELKKKRLEVQKLEQELRNLRTLQFENLGEK